MAHGGRPPIRSASLLDLRDDASRPRSERSAQRLRIIGPCTNLRTYQCLYICAYVRISRLTAVGAHRARYSLSTARRYCAVLYVRRSIRSVWIIGRHWPASDEKSPDKRRPLSSRCSLHPARAIGFDNRGPGGRAMFLNRRKRNARLGDDCLLGRRRRSTRKEAGKCNCRRKRRLGYGWLAFTWYAVSVVSL